MTKKITTRAKRTPRRVTASQANIKRALQDLGITVPFYRARVVGNRLELSLYGGDVVYWPPKKGE